MNRRIGLQIDPEDRALIEKITKARGEDLSVFVRRAIKKELAALGYISEDKMKALGLPKEAVRS